MKNKVKLTVSDPELEALGKLPKSRLIGCILRLRREISALQTTLRNVETSREHAVGLLNSEKFMRDKADVIAAKLTNELDKANLRIYKLTDYIVDKL